MGLIEDVGVSVLFCSILFCSVLFFSISVLFCSVFAAATADCEPGHFHTMSLASCVRSVRALPVGAASAMSQPQRRSKSARSREHPLTVTRFICSIDQLRSCSCRAHVRPRSVSFFRMLAHSLHSPTSNWLSSSVCLSRFLSDNVVLATCVRALSIFVCFMATTSRPLVNVHHPLPVGVFPLLLFLIPRGNGVQ